MTTTSKPTDERGYEYLDHPADVIIHGWGKTIEESFEESILGMFNYMTPLKGVDEIESTEMVTIEGAHDMDDLLYRLMDEFFFGFAANLFVCKTVKIIEMSSPSTTSTEPDKFFAKAIGRGETFNKTKHEQGTEIKAITMHNMHINQTPSRTDVFVTVNI